MAQSSFSQREVSHFAQAAKLRYRPNHKAGSYIDGQTRQEQAGEYEPARHAERYQ
jgi:hypothetical protein